jgi:hypothetical protein
MLYITHSNIWCALFDKLSIVKPIPNWLNQFSEYTMLIRTLTNGFHQSIVFGLEILRVYSSRFPYSQKTRTRLCGRGYTPALPRLYLAYGALHPAYSTPIEGRTGGGWKAYGLEDIARIHYGDGRSGIATSRAFRKSVTSYSDRHPIETVAVRQNCLYGVAQAACHELTKCSTSIAPL